MWSKTDMGNITNIQRICRSYWVLGRVLYLLAAVQLAFAIAVMLVARLSWLEDGPVMDRDGV